jgi:predicted O-methyltransferase YrrM
MQLKCQTNLLQDLTEFNSFLKFIRKHNIGRYLEIGSKHGGSLWRIGSSLPKGSRIVSVDLPHGDTSFKESEPHLRACVEELRRLGYDAHLFLSDSTEPETVERVRELGPFDLVFIDANHTEPFVWKDWYNYGPMAEVVAFHDINWSRLVPNSKKMPIEVPRVWAKLKLEFKHLEIKHCVQDNGIGILWRNQPLSN